MTNPPCAVCSRPAVKPALFGTRLCAEHRYEAAGEWAAWISTVKRYTLADDYQHIAEWVTNKREAQER